MKMTNAQHFTISAIFLLVALGLSSCAAITSKPTPGTVSGALKASSVESSSAISSTVSTDQSSVSTPAAYRIDTAILDGAHTSTDNSAIGTSGIRRSYSYKSAIADGSLVSITDTNTGCAVYNTAKFDAFIKKPTSKGIWVYHYILDNNTMNIHEMQFIEYIGSGFRETFYDPYDGTKNVENVERIVKEDWPNAIRYGAANKDTSDEDSARIMSFDKSCVYS